MNIRIALLATLLVTVAGCSSAPPPEASRPAPPPITTSAPATPEPTPAPAVQAPPRTAPVPKVAAQPAVSDLPPATIHPKPPVAPDQDPAIKVMYEQQAAQESKRLAIERAKKAVADSQAKVDELEKRLLAVKNPFLPRPQLPPDEAEAWKGLDGVARKERVEGQIADAKAELEQAKKALADLGEAP